MMFALGLLTGMLVAVPWVAAAMKWRRAAETWERTAGKWEACVNLRAETDRLRRP